MHSKKKITLTILAALTTAFVLTACQTLDGDTSSSNSAPITSLPSTETESSFSSEDLFSSESLDSGSSDEESSVEDSSVEEEYDEDAWAIVDEAYTLSTGEVMGYYTLSGTITKIDTPYSNGYVMLTFVVKGRENFPIYCYKLQGEGTDIVEVGDKITVYGSIKNYKGTVEFDKDCLLLAYESNNVKPDAANDPYANMSASTFYASYTPATSNEDAYYRTLHGFMSGELTVPDQAPTLAPSQPKQNGKYIRNSQMALSSDGKTYTVVDCYGEKAFEVYKDGAYITLEEVAAYVYAFGTYPANYTTSKNTKPTASVWGEYLRLNHTAFSGDTSRYPYEPVLPNITGCGGRLNYYEMDIGTTGTDCDPSYSAELYNNGTSITRGAARIVYGKNDLNNNGIYEIGEFYVFYTYNHYNDFQEYLNYEGGWGEMFGNITGGGTISSTSRYNPTDYVESVWTELPRTIEVSTVYAVAYPDRKQRLQTNEYPLYFVF